jgi:hypothetical protein
MKLKNDNSFLLQIITIYDIWIINQIIYNKK